MPSSPPSLSESGIIVGFTGVVAFVLSLPRRKVFSAIAGSGASTSTVAVYLVEEVVRPGVYYLPAGSHIVDAIRLAGGLTASADMASINMSMKFMWLRLVVPKGLEGCPLAMVRFISMLHLQMSWNLFPV